MNFRCWLRNLIGLYERPTDDAPYAPLEDRFREADRRNREAVVQARLSNRRLRTIAGGSPITGADAAIAALMRRMREQEERDG